MSFKLLFGDEEKLFFKFKINLIFLAIFYQKIFISRLFCISLLKKNIPAVSWTLLFASRLQNGK